MSLSLSKPYHPTSQAQVFKCIICEEEINTESSQRGLNRTKCNSCKKEKDRLVNMMYYWMNKVGIKFDIEDFESDFDTEEENGLEEFD